MANTPIWDNLDYSRNAVIEASAGTGKTYTLEHIVEKLVREDNYDIRSILLVTFTEKAAGELKERIRGVIAGTDTAKHLDEATICTIHSFCREVLASYPFESGMMMGMDIGGSDKALCERAVHNVLVSERFQIEYADKFELGMAYWATTKKTEEAERLDATTLSAAVERQLREIVSKDSFNDWNREFEEQKQSLRVLMTTISQLPREQDCGPGQYVLRYAGGLSSAQTTYFTGLDENLSIITGKYDDPSKMLEALKSIAKPKMDFMLRKWRDEKVNGAFCEMKRFEPYAKIKEAVPRCVEYLQYGLVKEVVQRAYSEFLRLKLRSSSVTFDDLIKGTARLVEAAIGPNATDAQKGFVKRMRDHYRMAMVDEFQDTDATQWRIFKRLFATEGHLIVVGDPKQAIYGWRGADLATYMSAKSELLEKNGQFESLGEMYRSTKEMVDDFHAMFSSGWFDGMKAGGYPIEYRKVDFPKANPPAKVKDFQYPMDESAVELLEARDGLAQFAANAANEMIRLNKEWTRYMGWDNMCVLVRANDVARLVQRTLQKKNIPCRFYHEGKFFAGEEAESILALLDYLSMPRSLGNLSALLLTPIFGFEPKDLDNRLKTGDAQFDWLCERWRNYADKHDWIRLFESVMRETKAVNNPAGYRQVFDQLLKDFGRANTVAELADALRALRNRDVSAEENGSIRNKTSETPAVQIMTMHAAKGLEFNAVFIAYGFAGNATDAETKRLLYVALTRAAFKLYLPWSRNVPKGGLGKKSSALNSYLGSAIRALCNGDVKGRMRDPGEQELEPAVQPITDRGEKPPRLGMKGWRFKWDSFSSLYHHAAPKTDEVEGTKVTNDELQGSAASGNDGKHNKESGDEKQESLVPKGALSGTVFHEVMERLCKNDKTKDEVDFEIGKEDNFDKLIEETEDKKSPLLEIVRRRLAANGVVNQVGDGETTASTIARMAWNALRTELDFGDDKFRLYEITHENRKAEVNFVLDEKLLLAAGTDRDGALNGSIDLLIKRDDGYYIVDWKTNALEKYDTTTVDVAMDDAGYHHQYQIYTLAAEKWLGDKTVKGVAYLFVRGGEFDKNPSGVFRLPIKDGDRTQFLDDLNERIGESDKEDEKREEEDR